MVYIINVAVVINCIKSTLLTQTLPHSVLPMSTVNCECGFCSLSRVKTDLRNCLSNRILNHLLTIAMEGPPPADFPYDIACDTWGEMRNRQIQVNV